MQIISDLQIHSKYSRAVSNKMDLTEIASWAKKKGIHLVATGDWTHPLWFREIKTKLKETAKGIYSLTDDQYKDVKFFLSTEISSIYTQGDKQRRVHNLIFSPSIETCEKIIQELQKRGANLMADGRPIVGISSKDLLELVLNIDPQVLFIPAHAWTPWFAMFGSKSGFDSIEECFEDLSGHIYAIETGLSSDPLMNWQVQDLDKRSIISFSDAHSGPKLGREATVFVSNSEFKIQNYEFTYNDIADAIKQKSSGKLKIGYTIEFFPEEGKYHWSGHRACNIRYTPQEIKEKGVICPVCHKPLTVGVENRVLDLSTRQLSSEEVLHIKNKVGLTFVYDKEKKRRPFVSMIPLLEIVTEINDGSHAKGQRAYDSLTTEFGTEFDILLRKDYEEIEKQGGKLLRESIQKVRERDIYIDPGYDGVFGVVKIFKQDATQKTMAEETSQQSLF